MRVKNCRETVGSQFLPRDINLSCRALWACKWRSGSKGNAVLSFGSVSCRKQAEYGFGELRSTVSNTELIGVCPLVLPRLVLRYRPKGVFGKGVVNSKNASEMRQKCVKMGLVLLGKEEGSRMRQKCVKIASKMRQKCAEHLWGRTPFGRYRVL